MKALIVIPTYNERDNIAALIEEIEKYVSCEQVHILVIDDNSPDKTAELVKELQKTKPFLFLLERPSKSGLASAYLAGFRYAIEKNYDVVFEMDADFSHNPKYLPEFLKKIENADLVIGSRYVKGGGVSNWSKYRLFISRGGNTYARLILCSSLRDMTGGFKCFRVDALKKIDLSKIKSGGYSFQIEMNYVLEKNGFRIVEIPIVFEERREGQSKMSKKIFLEAMKRVWYFRFMNVKKYLREE